MPRAARNLRSKFQSKRSQASIIRAGATDQLRLHHAGSGRMAMVHSDRLPHRRPFLVSVHATNTRSDTTIVVCAGRALARLAAGWLRSFMSSSIDLGYLLLGEMQEAVPSQSDELPTVCAAQKSAELVSKETRWSRLFAGVFPRGGPHAVEFQTRSSPAPQRLPCLREQWHEPTSRVRR